MKNYTKKQIEKMFPGIDLERPSTWLRRCTDGMTFDYLVIYPDGLCSWGYFSLPSDDKYLLLSDWGSLDRLGRFPPTTLKEALNPRVLMDGDQVACWIGHINEYPIPNTALQAINVMLQYTEDRELDLEFVGNLYA